MKDVRFLDFIQEGIQQVEQRILSQSDGHYPEIKFALEHILSSGGKRVRPAIVLLVGGLLGGGHADLVTLGASVELLHTATLVHDDLIDGALLRRGNSTLNASWTPAATVLTGDYFFSRSASLGAELDDPVIVRHFADTLATIVSGEIAQLFSRNTILDRETYNKRIFEKTASLFQLAAKGAALLSQGDEEVVAYASDYGYQLGMAFQIVDDILDFTGEQAKVGKPVASDLRQGIITLPVIYYQELHPGDDSVERVLEGEAEEGQLDALIGDIQASKAVELSYQEAEGYVKRALEALANLPHHTDDQSWMALKELAEFVVFRKN